MMNISYAFVIGAGGLLGRSVLQQCRNAGMYTDVARDIPWNEDEEAVQVLTDQLRSSRAQWEASCSAKVSVASPDSFSENRFNDEADSSLNHRLPWAIFWCAGAGVTGTNPKDLDTEVRVFSSVLDALEREFTQDLGNLTFFYASSAGAVYAGSENPPFTEESDPRPLSPYGGAKLRCEARLQELAARGVRVAVGRISNLYGPGQNIWKPQGLISQICLAYHKGECNKIFVSLDTLRDYIYIDDAASLIVRYVEAVSLREASSFVVKILCHGSAMSIGELIGTAKSILKRPPQFVQVASRQTKFQARDLRLRSLVMPELDKVPKRTFPSGFMMTNEDVGSRYRLHMHGGR